MSLDRSFTLLAVVAAVGLAVFMALNVPSVFTGNTSGGHVERERNLGGIEIVRPRVQISSARIGTSGRGSP